MTATALSEVALEMKIQTVAESSTVTASADPVETKQSSGSNSITESTVRNMPNLDERFDSLLPLIPGVVRGPNGHINMKGARASQNGSLLNSADVTDPATGRTTNWGFEMGPPHGLQAGGWTRETMKLGDEVRVNGSRAKNGSNKVNARNVILVKTGKKMGAASSEGDAATQ